MGLRGYPESPNSPSDDGETVDRPKSINDYEDLSTVNPPRKGVRKYNYLFLPENLKKISLLLDVLRRIAEKRGGALSQIALNWLIRNPNVIVIPGAKSVEQVESNAGAAGWKLSDYELKIIDEALSKLKLSFLRSLPRLIIRGIFGI